MSYKRSKYFSITSKRKIKYLFLNKKSQITLVFFHGFMSNMMGAKPMAIQKFCRKQKLKEAIVKSVKLLQKSSFDDVSKVINDALKLGANNDYGYDYVKDFEERFQIKARNPITTGWDQIDLICRNGLGRGELGVVIAPTGAGKSMVLVHLGAEALKLSLIHI